MHKQRKQKVHDAQHEERCARGQLDTFVRHFSSVTIILLQWFGFGLLFFVMAKLIGWNLVVLSFAGVTVVEFLKNMTIISVKIWNA